jgi:hypothetical protein
MSYGQLMLEYILLQVDEEMKVRQIRKEHVPIAHLFLDVRKRLQVWSLLVSSFNLIYFA